MVDPVGLIHSQQTSGVNPVGRGFCAPGAPVDPAAPSFNDVLMQNLQQVNDLQQDANAAAEDLSTGRRNDLETVLMATAKADTAFRMLLAVRNKMMDAYEEIKQIRV